MMILMILALTAVGSASVIQMEQIGSHQCRPSTWCSDLETAKRCGTFKLCVKTAWKKAQITTQDTNECKFCEFFTTEARSMLRNNKSQVQVLTYIEQACGLLPDLYGKQCKKIINTYAHEFFDLVVSELDPKYICQLIRLCTKSSVGSPSHFLSKIGKLHSVNTSCSDCTKFITDAQLAVRSNTTVEELKNYLKNELCKNFGSYAALCDTVVDMYAAQVLDALANDLKPADFCQAIGFCNSTTSHKLNLKEWLKQNVHLKKEHERIPCKICHIMINTVGEMLKNKVIQEKVTRWVNIVVCNRVMPLAQKCEQMVDSNLPEIMNFLGNALYAPAVCHNLGFCTNSSMHMKVSRPLPLSMPQLLRKALPIGKGHIILKKLSKTSLLQKLIKKTTKSGAYCSTCKKVMSYFPDFIRDKQMQVQVEELVDTYLCNNLGRYAKLCKEEVATYIPELFQLLASELDPVTICTEIGLCTSSKSNLLMGKLKHSAQSKKKRVEKVGASVECVLCEFVMKELDGLLEKNSTEQQIEKAINKVCSLLPHTLKSDCTAFVEQYGKLIIDLLVKELDTYKVCTHIHLCKNKKSASIKKAPKSEECELCKYIAQFAVALLKEQALEQDVEMVLDKVCSELPPSYAKQCGIIVSQYTPDLIQYLIDTVDPNTICSKLGLCNSSLEKHVLGQVQLTKSSTYYKCVAGPTYWCASKWNAKLCKAEEHCKNHVWQK